ncbi:MAG: hypothetical protein V1917_00785 [Candidatus Gottesmanbacteria bacterium]
MKKLIVVICVALITPFVTPVYGEEGATSTRAVERLETRGTQKAEKREEIQTNATTRLKEKANKEIDRRIASLTKLIDKINAVKRLTAAQKTEMAVQVQTEITSLTNLKTTIAGLTDIAALRTSVQSIVKSYRIYVLYIPKMTIIANADKILNLVEKEMAALTEKLQLRINEANGKGYSVEVVTALMAERQTKLTEATTQATAAITKVVGLTPDGWPGNKTELQSARNMLQLARKAMNDAQKFANQVRTQLKAMGSPKTTVTPTPTESE